MSSPPLPGAVAPYDPRKLMDAVTDRIKAEFVGMIPPEQWKEMVNKEVTNFFTATVGRYNNQETPSDFTKLIHQLLTEKIKEIVTAELGKPEWSAVWQDHFGTYQLSQQLQKVLVEAAPDMLAAVMREHVHKFMLGIRKEY